MPAWNMALPLALGMRDEVVTRRAVFQYSFADGSVGDFVVAALQNLFLTVQVKSGHDGEILSFVHKLRSHGHIQDAENQLHYVSL